MYVGEGGVRPIPAQWADSVFRDHLKPFKTKVIYSIATQFSFPWYYIHPRWRYFTMIIDWEVRRYGPYDDDEDDLHIWSHPDIHLHLPAVQLSKIGH